MNDRAEGKIETRHHAERSIVLESLLLAAVALLVLNFHPFGSAHLRRHFSQDLIYAWFGDAEWLYPRHPTASRQDARAVVMLVDDAALAARGARWPVPIGFHAQLLAEVGVLRPRAIMLDFLLMDNASSGDICSLLETAARLRAAGTSLYLAMTTQQDLAAPAHASCAGPGGQRLDPSRLFVPVSVSRQVDEADFASRRYPFADSASDERGSSGVASAAVRIYCDLSSDSPGCETRLTRGLTPDAGFELAWSPSGDPFNARWSRSPCRSAATLRTLLDRTVLPRILACPPVATLFASELLNPAEDQNLGSDNETLFALMQGSVVFIGGNFRAGGDLVTTPLHTFLPGVYYHAMAFQNLETFAGEPKVREEFRSFKIGIFVYDLLVLWALAAIFVWRERRNRGGAPVTHHGSFAPSDSASDWFAGAFARLPVAVSLGVFVAVAVLLAAYPRVQLAVFLAAAAVVIGVEIVASSRFEFRRLLRSAGLYALALGLSLGVVALAVWFGYRWLRLPPGDWVGYLSFSTVGFFVAHTAVVDFGRRIGSIRRACCITRIMRVVVLTALLLLALKLQAADLQSAADPPCAAPRSIVGVRTKDGPVPLMRGDAASGFHPACAVRWKVLSPNNQPLVVSACFRDSLLQIDNETACGVVSGRLWIPARWVVTSGVPVTPKTPLTTCHRLETEAYAVTRGLDPACIPKK